LSAFLTFRAFLNTSGSFRARYMIQLNQVQLRSTQNLLGSGATPPRPAAATARA